MLFILIAFVTSFCFLYSTCRLHSNVVQNEKTHYQKQFEFYAVDESEIQKLQNELRNTKDIYESNYSKCLSKLNKLESEMYERVNKYAIDPSNMENDILKEIKNIDIKFLTELVMEENHD